MIGTFITSEGEGLNNQEIRRSEGDYRWKVLLVLMRYKGNDVVREVQVVKLGGVRGACTDDWDVYYERGPK